MKLKYKISLIFLLLLTLFLLIGSVSAETVTNNTVNDVSVVSDINDNTTNFVTSNNNYYQSENSVNAANTEGVNMKNKVYDEENGLIASSQTYYISPTGTGTGLSVNSPTNWNNAYNQINEGGIIVFTPGSYNIVNQSIQKNLTLTSYNNANVILDANNQGYIFSGGYRTITIIGLTFIQGTGCYEMDSTCGGAIDFDGYLNLINSTFINNSATGYGGAVFANYINVEGSTFINNSAEYGSGGAIVAWDNANITNSTFINNSVYTSRIYMLLNFGGAVFSWDNITVEGSTFINNSARNNGGAICSKRGNVIVINSDFTNNTSQDMYGGAIYTNNTSIINSSFFNNDANGEYGNGGAIFAEENLNVINSTFSGNSANLWGGAVYVTNNSTVIGSTFVNNTQLAEGNSASAICSDNIIINGSTFINNTGKVSTINSKNNANVYNSSFISNFVPYYGKAISAKNVNVSYSVFYSSVSNGNYIIYDDSCIANYNWWGENDPFSSNDNGSLILHNHKGYIRPDNWVILNLTMDSTQIVTGENATLTASLNQYYDANSKTYKYLSENLPSRIIKFTTTGGNFNPNITNITGSVNTIYTAPAINGTYFLSGNVDYLSISMGVIVKYPSTLIKTSISGSDFTESYGDGLFYNSTLKDKNGNVLAGRIAKMTLTKPSTGASKTYWVTSDSEGKFSLQINLAPGSYIVTTNFDGDNQYNPSSLTNTITVNPQVKVSTSLIAYDFSESYGAAQNFTATLKTSNGNPIIGQHITLLLIKPSNKATKTYYTSTDVNGNAYLEINLATGNYLVVCSYDGNSQYVSSTGTATITVTH